MKSMMIDGAKLILLALCFILPSPFLKLHASQTELHNQVKSMIMVGFRDKDLDHILQQDRVGGYILFAKDYLTKEPRNIYSYSNLCHIVDKIRGHGISMIAADVEGGAVNRLENLAGFELMPSAALLSLLDRHSYKNDSIYGVSKFFAAQLFGNGITINFTPVVDVLVNADPKFFLRERIFSNRSDIVAAAAEKVIQAHHRHGVTTVLKHFPGHGSAEGDSHFGYVDITNTWKQDELMPYKRLIAKKRAEMIMIGHLMHRKFDEKYPSSMSYNIVTGLLRKKLKYDGPVITDSIDMEALHQHFTLKEIVISSINAGVDIILHANQMQYDPDIGSKIYDIIMKAVYDGKISRERISLSYRRISSISNKYKAADNLGYRMCHGNLNIFAEIARGERVGQEKYIPLLLKEVAMCKWSGAQKNCTLRYRS